MSLPFVIRNAGAAGEDTSAVPIIPVVLAQAGPGLEI
jgi:hypothetical protein